MKNIPTIIVLTLICIGGITLALSIFGEGALAAYSALALIMVSIFWLIKNEK